MKLTLTPGQSALFGYGSLLSIRSLERTLGRTYDGPFSPCVVTGWRRTWDAAMPNDRFFADTADGPMYPERILYLNVRPDPAVPLNGVLFVVNPTDLASFDQRESIYDRLDVTEHIDVEVENGKAYIYVCKPEHCWSKVDSPRKGAIRASYIEIVETGLSDFGPEFRARYLATTDVPQPNLVIHDRS